MTGPRSGASMDFFEHQDLARRQTGRLVVFFVLAVACIVLAAYLVVAGTIVASQAGGHHGEPHLSLWDPGLLAVVGLGTLLVVAGGSLVKTWQLRGGGAAVAEMLGGRPLDPSRADPAGRRLLNVVEEMAIASGTPVPQVWVLEQEGAINAFAAGHGPDDAVIGVTRGTLEQLDRDQLQGVVAHEFSHLLNGDMRLNIRLMGLVHGILVIGLLGYTILRSLRFAGRRRSGKGGGGVAAVAAIGVGLLAVGYTGVFFGNLIKAAVSRQREFLADASAVQFTRHPEGIAGALKVIGAHAFGSVLEHRSAAEASHMFFGSGVKPWLASAFATHPPLAERIRRIDPAWDGTFPAVAPLSDRTASGRAAADGLWPRGRRVVGVSPLDAATRPPATASALSLVGRPSPEHVAHSRQLLAALPEAVTGAAREPNGARAVVHALLIGRQPALRARQLDLLAQGAEDGVSAETRRLLPLVDGLPPRARLPLLDLALPALRRLTPSQHAAFAANVDRLVAADAQVDLFEWALGRILRRHLRPALQPARRPRVLYHAFGAPLAGPCSRLLSALARAGQADTRDARAAFDAAAAHLREVTLAWTAGVAGEDAPWTGLDAALDVLAEISAPMKRRLLLACATSIAADREVTVEEAELFRAVADALDCPVPPVLPGQPLA